MGVKRAVFIAEKELKENARPIHFLGNLVHNENVIQRFKEKGVRFIKKPAEAKKGTLIIQAHGFPPFKISQKISIKDATCPLVKKAQDAAKKLTAEGYQVIIIGEKNHPEVKGILANAKNAIVVENETRAEKLKKVKKAGVIAQTTQSFNKTNLILKILREKTEKLKWIDTLCPEVVLRQKELSEIINKTGGILVIGSKLSANTLKLVETAKSFIRPVWRVNSLEEIKKIKFGNLTALGVVSGTSAPDWLVEDIKKYLIKND